MFQADLVQFIPDLFTGLLRIYQCPDEQVLTNAAAAVSSLIKVRLKLRFLYLPIVLHLSLPLDLHPDSVCT